MRRTKNLLVAFMPFKLHLHNPALDVVQPWIQSYWRHPFMHDILRIFDPGPPR